MPFPFCLQADVPVDATDHKGLTPLMMACMFGRSLMAAYLLGRGARPHLTDMNGDSALHWAAYKGFPSLMQVLAFSLTFQMDSFDLLATRPTDAHLLRLRPAEAGQLRFVATPPRLHLGQHHGRQTALRKGVFPLCVNTLLIHAVWL